MGLLPKDRNLGWAPYAYVIYLAFFLVWPTLKPNTSLTEWALTIGTTAVFLVLFFRCYWTVGRERLLIIAAITLIAEAWYPFNWGAGCFFIYAAAFAGFIAERPVAIWTIAVIEIICVIETVAAHVHPMSSVWPLFFTLVIGGLNMHQAEVNRSNARLRLAHDEIEHLAKVAERERIARDLHDLLGHTLSLVILKAELASKLADRDLERARSEIRDVERISREALAQVRAAVRGYRSGGLQAELDSAREALTAANVTTSITLAPMQLPAAHEAVLALAIREAATNIVRHAAASHCTIELAEGDGSLQLRIRDDGRGGNAPFGSGLSGMQERIESLGGSLARDGSKGMMLTITLPHVHNVAVIGERSA